MYSNQQVINAFYVAAHTLNAKGQNLAGWDLIVEAKLEQLADHRHAAYSGQPLDKLPLAAEIVWAVESALAAMPPAFDSTTVERVDYLLSVPWVSQLDANSTAGADCGHACVLMLLKYYDNPPSPDILSDTTVDNLVNLMRDIDVRQGRPRRAKNTTSDQDLVDLAAANGLELRADRNFKNLDKAMAQLKKRRPVIVLVNYLDLQFPDHLQSGPDQGWYWLVIVGSSNGGNTFIVNDPLWTPQARSNRGGKELQIARATLTRALRLNRAVY